MSGSQTSFADGEGEAALWAAFKQDGSMPARERLFAHHAAFARNIARRHYREQSRGDLDVMDLQQLAYAGLLEALDRFDPGQGVPFRAFAAHRISGSVSDGLVRMTEVREQISWRSRVRRERVKSLSDDGMNELDTGEAMEKLAEIAVGLALGFMLEGTGLFVEDEEATTPSAPATAYDSVAWKDIVTRLHDGIAALPDRERMILQEHYVNGVNFDQLAAVLGLTKGRISQLHRAALQLLRKRLASKGHFGMGR